MGIVEVTIMICRVSTVCVVLDTAVGRFGLEIEPTM